MHAPVSVRRHVVQTSQEYALHPGVRTLAVDAALPRLNVKLPSDTSALLRSDSCSASLAALWPLARAKAHSFVRLVLFGRSRREWESDAAESDTDDASVSSAGRGFASINWHERAENFGSGTAAGGY